ncbi:hypothetical protein SALBM311S_04385 [Streptomyces alboniger]
MPSWAWHEHANDDPAEDAFLFSFNDFPMIKNLGLFQEEAYTDNSGHRDGVMPPTMPDRDRFAAGNDSYPLVATSRLRSRLSPRTGLSGADPRLSATPPLRRGCNRSPWSLISLLAAAILTVIRARTTRPAGIDLVPASPRELLAVLRATVIPTPRRDLDHVLHWSAWRRRHQHRATACHRHWNNATAEATT